MCIQLKDYEEATRHLTLAVALNPKDPLPWGRLGISYDDRLGHEEAARLAWAQSRRLQGDGDNYSMGNGPGA